MTLSQLQNEIRTKQKQNEKRKDLQVLKKVLLQARTHAVLRSISD